MSTNKLLHAIVAALLVGLTIWALQHSEFYREAGKGKRFGIVAVVIFIELLVLNLIWPFTS